jgi:pimeloyl-ACP methyl ester carboxylesterase
LRRRGYGASVPDLHERFDDQLQYWQQYASAAARAVQTEPVEPVTLVAHSGAGSLLPAIRELMERPVEAYLFVDAGIPVRGKNWLEQVTAEAPEFAAQVEARLRAGERSPRWTDEDLKDILPDDDVRRRLLAELHPQPLEYFTQVIPVFEGWPDAPCGVLQFSPPYDAAFAHAQQQGWPARKLDAGHFHFLVDPEAVADAMLELLSEMQVAQPQSVM